MNSESPESHLSPTGGAGGRDDDEFTRTAETTVREFLVAGARRGLSVEQMFPQ